LQPLTALPSRAAPPQTQEVAPPFASSTSNFDIEIDESDESALGPTNQHLYPFGRPPPFLETAGVDNITPQQALAIQDIAQILNGLDYFVVLGVSPQSTSVEIKKRFHNLSRTYHPDRFFHLANVSLREQLNIIYKRVTEAYFVLRDDAMRSKYAADVAGPERIEKLRFTETSEAEQKAEARKQVVEEFGTNPKARPFFKSAVADIENKNYQSAERNLKMGLTYEPTNQRFKQMYQEVQKSLDDARRTEGGNFNIK
jgi:DnaJ domain